MFKKIIPAIFIGLLINTSAFAKTEICRSFIQNISATAVSEDLPIGCGGAVSAELKMGDMLRKGYRIVSVAIGTYEYTASSYNSALTTGAQVVIIFEK